MSIVTPGGLQVVGCWTAAGVNSCVHIRGQRRGEDILFDCGLVEPSTFSAASVFISHGHIDHIGSCVSHARARALTHSVATYYMPENCIEPIQAVKDAFERLDGREIPMILSPISPGMSVEITSSIKVLAFPTMHRVPSQGYAVYTSSKSNKLKEEYRHLDRIQIKELIKSGVDAFQPHVDVLELCYTGDTIFEGLLSPQSSFIFNAPLLIMELTYLDGDPQKAETWGHVHINDVISQSQVFRNQQILFVHLSQKYNPYSRAVTLLKRNLPEHILVIAAVSLYSFGSGYGRTIVRCEIHVVFITCNYL
jgi:ribonuclease BN (tRNA processing enzyme)